MENEAQGSEMKLDNYQQAVCVFFPSWLQFPKGATSFPDQGSYDYYQIRVTLCLLCLLCLVV